MSHCADLIDTRSGIGHATRTISLLVRTIALFPLLCGVPLARSQEPPQGAYEVSSIEFEGNETIGEGQLLEHMTTRESPGFLGKLLYSISEALGSENYYFDQTAFDNDIVRIRTLYEDNGFPSVKIDTTLAFSAEDRTVDLLLKITEGERAFIDSIVYSGLVGGAGEVWVGIADDPLLEQGMPFQRSVVEAEIRRVRDILRNEGYANAVFVRDSSGAFRRLSSGNYTVVLHYDRGKRYKFGDILVEQLPDSLEEKEALEDIVRKQIDYEPGMIFSEAKRRSSERNLNRVGMFEQATIAIDVPPDSVELNDVTSFITLRPADKHELAPEVSISDEDKTFNLGTGLIYTQRNFFGGARTFTAGLRFRTQTLLAFPRYFEVNSNAVSNLDLSFQVLQPYVFTNKVKARWTFSLIFDKQELYRQEIFRNTFAFTVRMGHYSTGYLDWTLQRVRLQRNTTVELDLSDPEIKEQFDQLLIQERETQFNSIISFTATRDRSNDIFSPSEGLIHSATLEESGFLPLILQQDLPFTQFYRVVLLGRWYFDPGGERFSILAFKLKGGWENKYGESRSDTTRVIPQTHRFYAGGGGSVRGWNSRELSATGVPELGGNLAFEGSMELRMHVFRSFRDDLLDKIWLVGFVDAGNVWDKIADFRPKGVAIASGLGFRYDSFFGPFRIDFGIRIYDPRASAGRKWITQRKFFGETLGDGVLHFGIGHAF